jgi:flagellar hook-length control protein FliK
MTATNGGPVSGKNTVGEAKPMTITLSENLSQTSSNTNIGTLELKSESKPLADGQSFGQFMSEMFQLQTETSSATAQDKSALAELQGQEIAAPLTLAEQAAALDTQTWSLKAVTLGPHLSVITPETSPPDTQSLEAFARSQGLDENAVNWLFGGQAGAMPAVPAPPTGGTNALTTTSAIGALGGVIATPTSTPAASLLSDSAQTAQGAAPSAPTAPTAPTSPSATTLTSSALQGSVGMPANASGSAAAGQANGTPNGQNTGQNTGAATGLLGSGLAAAQALWSMADAPEKSNKPGVNASTEDALPIQMLRMPPPAAVWMQRSLISNVSQSIVSAQKEAEISLSELDLGADWGGETLAQLLGAEGNASSANSASSTGTHGSGYANFASRWDAQASNRSDLSNANGPAPDLPDANARSENIQNLADKMGQAVGQRILSEMEKGQWHLKLQLRPATLGHIEVEMRMRSGEFDAIFTAPNGTTRDLLQDGMSKLRETLSQMGMDVANIHVGGGQTGQSGGDSTPGFSRSQPAQVQASAPETTTEIARAPRVKDPNDGLDVLV